MNEPKAKGGSSQKSNAAQAPVGLLAVAWLVPGLGHWLLKRKTRAVVFALVICCAFVTGVILDGELGAPQRGNPFSWLATIACLGNGILYLVRMLWLNGLSGVFGGGFPFGIAGGGDSVAAGFAYGNTFLYTAGLMNLLTVLDVSDIARGEKD